VDKDNDIVGPTKPRRPYPLHHGIFNFLSSLRMTLLHLPPLCVLLHNCHRK
jgi:hypothetical protein